MQHLDLCSHASKKDVLSVSEVEVNLLDGRRWTVTVNPTTATSGDVLEGVLREAEIGEAGYHSLAIQLTGARDSHEEYCPLANEVKLAKVAPQVRTKFAEQDLHNLISLCSDWCLELTF